MCGVGPRGAPPRGDDVIPQSLKMTLAAFGVTDDVTVQGLKAALKAEAELFMRSLCSPCGETGSLKAPGGTGNGLE